MFKTLGTLNLGWIILSLAAGGSLTLIHFSSSPSWYSFVVSGGCFLPVLLVNMFKSGWDMCVFMQLVSAVALTWIAITAWFEYCNSINEQQIEQPEIVVKAKNANVIMPLPENDTTTTTTKKEDFVRESKAMSKLGKADLAEPEVAFNPAKPFEDDVLTELGFANDQIPQSMQDIPRPADSKQSFERELPPADIKIVPEVQNILEEKKPDVTQGLNDQESVTEENAERTSMCCIPCCRKRIV